MIMNNMIKVVDATGMEIEVEVLDIFRLTDNQEKEYIMYTQNKEVDENNIEVFVSILKQDGNNFQLLNIEDEEEWKKVQKAIDEMGELNE